MPDIIVELKQSMAELVKAIKDGTANPALTEAAIAGIVRGELGKLSFGRKTEYPNSNDIRHAALMEVSPNVDKVYRMAEFMGHFPEDLQNKSDDAYITAAIMGCHPKQLKMYDSLQGMYSKAMDTETAEEGAEWVPTQFSPRLLEEVRLLRKVAALHQRFSMPTPTFTFPVEGADAVAYLAGQATSDTETKFTASTPGTDNLSFTAVKHAVRVLVAREMEEDSIVPALAYITGKIVKALAEAEEDTTINGDTTGTHQDADVTDSDDRRKAWKGYRKHALSAAKVDLSTFSLANLRAIRTAMGKYGLNPADLAWVSGISVFNKLLGLDEVKTVDKYGPGATILSGELAKVDGIPIIVSEFIDQDLNAAGVQDGQTETKTVLPLVYRPGFMYGDRRQVSVQVLRELYAETDQDGLISTRRLDFKPMLDATSEAIVGLGYNIAS